MIMNKGEKSSKEKRKEAISLIFYVIFVIAATFLIVHYVGQRTEVSGWSMYPTLEDKDNLIVDKISYRFTDPKRYDIIVFPYAYEEKTYYIKRIIGLPGESVQVIDGYVYINGKQLDEHYGREVMNFAGLAQEELTLGADEYFVLGDNRNDSSDSRDPSVGILKRQDIIGRAFIRIWPFSRFGRLKHE